jgi:uncharacterized protein (TIGR00369 family)
LDAVMSEDDLADFLAREFPEARGISVERVTEAGLVARMAVGEGDLRPGGTISGPSIFALADVAVYLAVLSRIGPVALAVTTNATIDFMRKPAAGVDLRAEVRLLKLGRQLAVADALIYSDGQPDPVARASMTFAIPPAR